LKPEIVTIGVYGFNEEQFFKALQEAHIDTFIDIRRRRGVRGSQYAFANSQRLQKRLAELNIRYIHRLDLAPSPAVRQQQDAADQATKTAKRQRATLDPAFIEGYRQEILNYFDPTTFLPDLGPDAHVIALFCVEREPAACHRSLLAQHLANTLHLPVRHLLPPEERAA
jgi:uncharacterized protein (DUF488 family)